jgi:hypothetical protein
MKNLLFIFAFLFPLITHSQKPNICDDPIYYEWYQKIDSPLEFIVYKNNKTNLYSIRVYRGEAEEHMVTIMDQYGDITHKTKMGKETDLDLDFLSCGYYIIELRNEEASRYQVIIVQ